MSPRRSHKPGLRSIYARSAGSTVVSPCSAFRSIVFNSSCVGAFPPCASVMPIKSFCVECGLEQHRAQVPPGVELLVECVKGGAFLAPGLGLSLPLGVAFGILHGRQLGLRAGSQVGLRDPPMTPNTPII